MEKREKWQTEKSEQKHQDCRIICNHLDVEEDRISLLQRPILQIVPQEARQEVQVCVVLLLREPDPVLDVRGRRAGPGRAHPHLLELVQELQAPIRHCIGSLMGLQHLRKPAHIPFDCLHRPLQLSGGFSQLQNPAHSLCHSLHWPCNCSVHLPPDIFTKAIVQSSPQPL